MILGGCKLEDRLSWADMPQNKRVVLNAAFKVVHESPHGLSRETFNQKNLFTLTENCAPQAAAQETDPAETSKPQESTEKEEPKLQEKKTEGTSVSGITYRLMSKPLQKQNGEPFKQTHFYFIPHELKPNTHYCLKFGPIETASLGPQTLETEFDTVKVDKKEYDDQPLTGQTSLTKTHEAVPYNLRAVLVRLSQATHPLHIKEGALLCENNSERVTETSQDSVCSGSERRVQNGTLKVFMIEQLLPGNSGFIEVQKNLFAFSPTLPETKSSYDLKIQIKNDEEDVGYINFKDQVTTFKVNPPIEKEAQPRDLIQKASAAMTQDDGVWFHTIEIK